MLMHLSSWPEIDARLKTTKTVVVPIGSNEQHGPTGLLGTDWLCPEIIAHAAEKSDESLVVAPTFNIGMAQHHLAFPGTITLRPSTFMAAISDWVSSLTRHGFERIYFLNGHGGNVATIEATFSEIYAEWSFVEERSPFVLKLRNWWDLPGVTSLCNGMFPTGHGMHATPSEIARAIYDAGPAEGLRRLSAWLAEQHRAGRLDVPDPDQAAETFTGMVLGHAHLRTMLDVPQHKPEVRSERAREAAARFVKAYSA